MGNVPVEPLVGKAVLVAGRDILLELHRITARLNRTEAVISACPCLAPPASCHPGDANETREMRVLLTLPLIFLVFFLVHGCSAGLEGVVRFFPYATAQLAGGAQCAVRMR
jgi:hypothetical protein